MRRVLFLALGVLALGAPVHAAKSTTWRIPTDFATIQAAIDSTDVEDGDTLALSAGSHAGAYVTKRLTIDGGNHAVIDDGPVHGSGLIMGFRLRTGSTGCTFKNLVFEVDLAIIPEAVVVDDVTVKHCRFLGAVQAVSAWRGSGWTISHNEITDLRTKCGGGIGILLGDYTGGAVRDNVVEHNDITGDLYVSSGDCGGYNGTGIVLYADFRWGRTGADEIRDNRVRYNTVSLTTVIDTAHPPINPIDVAGIELTDTRDDEDQIVIFDNTISHNDLRGTALAFDFTPDALEYENALSKNKE